MLKRIIAEKRQKFTINVHLFTKLVVELENKWKLRVYLKTEIVSFYLGTLTGVVDATANDLYGTPLGTVDSTDLDLDDSVGVAMELGMDYMLNDNFGLNAAIWWADINTDATISAYSGGTKVAEVTTEVEIDPMVYMVGFTYKF